MIINELVTKFSVSGLTQGIRAVGSTMGNMQRQADSALGKIEGSFKRAGQGLKDALKASVQVDTSKAKSEISAVERMGAKLATMAVGFVGLNSLVDLGKGIFETATSFESLKIGLETATGSSAQANREFKRLQQFAAVTPYRVEEVVSAFTRLKNLNLDASTEALKAYGGFASATPGKKINDFVEAVADAVVGENERLKEFGIKAKKNGDQVSFTFKGVTQTVKNNAADIEKYLINLGKTNFGSAMEKQSKTVGGQVSNLQDAFQQMQFEIWEGGLKQPVNQLIAGLSKLTTAMQPIARQAGIFIKLNLPGTLKAIADIMPVVNFGLGVMFARMVGIQTLQFAQFIGTLTMGLQGMTFAQVAFNIAAFALPTIIGAIVIAVGALTLDFIRFFTTGQSMLLDFTKKWPWLHNSIKTVYTFAQTFFYALQIGFERIGKWIGVVAGQLSDGFGRAWRDISGGVQFVWNKVAEFFNWLGQKIPFLGQLGQAFSSAFNFANGGGGGGIVNDPNFPLNNTAAAQLVANARRVYTGASRCFAGVSQAYQKTFGDFGKLNGGSAYMAANQLATDKRFREISIDPRNPMSSLVNGAIVVYNQQAGFSQKHGHIEVIDKDLGKAYFGNGARNINNTSAQMWQNARAFVPIDAAAAPKTQVLPKSAGGSGAFAGYQTGPVTINNYNTLAGSSNMTPAQITGAMSKGSTQGSMGAFDSYVRNLPQRVSPR